MPAARKVATNLSLRADVIREAKALGLKLSEVCERALIEAVHEARRQRWLADNRDAIASYNAAVERDGLFSDDWRRF